MNSIEKYFTHQINGLILILLQKDSDKNSMISKDYMIEKLKMILSDGIGFHSSILEKLKK